MLGKFVSASLPVGFLAALTLTAGLAFPLRDARAAPSSDDVACLASSVFRHVFKCVAEGNCSEEQARVFTDDLRVHTLDSASCYSRIGITQAFRPAAGQYLIWRNVDHDIWVKLDDGGQDAPTALAALGNIAPLLKRRFPSLSYDGIQITPAPVTFDGIATLERGYSLGSAQGRQSVDAKAFIEALQETQKRLEQARADAEACVTAPASQGCAEAKARMAVAAKELRGQLVAEASAAAASAQADGPASASTGSTAQNGTAAADTTATSPKAEGDATGEPGGSSDVEGSGGILPAGAPPWIADLLDMILTYFGVSEVVKGAALALFLLAPDVVDSLASFSASLTKGLNNADLNQGFAAIKQLYQFYNALSSAMDNLSTMAKEGGFKNVGAMLMETGKVIEALPPALQSELTQQVGQKVKEVAEDAAAISGAIDPEVLAALVSGDADKALQALGEEAARQSEAELRRQAQKLLEQELGVDLTKFAGVAQALVDGDRDAAVSAAERYVEREVAERLGVDPELLATVRKSNAPLEKVQSLAAGRVAAKLAELAGLPALGQEQLRAALRDTTTLNTLMQRVAAEHQEQVGSWIAGLVEGKVPPELVRKGNAYLRERLPAEMRDLDFDASPETLAANYIRALHKKDINRVIDALAAGRDLAELAKDFPGTVERLRAHPKLQPAEIRKRLITEAERRVRRELEGALGEPLQRGLDALEVSAGIMMQIKAHLIDPNPTKLASVIWHDARRRLESPAAAVGSLASRARSCVDMEGFAATGLALEQAKSDLVVSLNAIEPGLLPLGQSSLDTWVGGIVAEHCPTGTEPEKCARATCSAVRDGIAKRVAGLDAYLVRGEGLAVNVADAAALLAAVDTEALAPPAFERLRRAVTQSDAAALGKEVVEGLVGIPADATARAAWLQERLVATGVAAEEAAAAVAGCLDQSDDSCLQVALTRNGVPITSWRSLVEGVVDAQWAVIEAGRARMFSDFQATCGGTADFGKAVEPPAFSKDVASAVLLGDTPPAAETLAAQLMCCQDRCTAEALKIQMGLIAEAATARAGAAVGPLQGLLAQGPSAVAAAFDDAAANTSQAIVSVASPTAGSQGALPLSSAIEAAVQAAATPAASIAANDVEADATAGLLKLQQLQQLATCVKKKRLECSGSDANWDEAPCSNEYSRCKAMAQNSTAGGP